MADKKISALPDATLPLDGTESLGGVQAGSNARITVADIVHKGRTESVLQVVSVTGMSSVDLSTDARVFTSTLVEDTTFTFDNVPSNGSTEFRLVLTQDTTGGWVATLPATISWEGGTAPEMSTAAGSITHLRFYTVDGGTVWYGLLETNVDEAPVTSVDGQTGAVDLSSSYDPAGAAAGVTFKSLPDTPADYTGAAGMAVKVKQTEDGLEFVASDSGGSTMALPLQNVTASGLYSVPASDVGKTLVIDSTSADGAGLELPTSVPNGSLVGILNIDGPEVTVTNSYVFAGNTQTNAKVAMHTYLLLIKDASGWKVVSKSLDTSKLLPSTGVTGGPLMTGTQLSYLNDTWGDVSGNFLPLQKITLNGDGTGTTDIDLALGSVEITLSSGASNTITFFNEGYRGSLGNQAVGITDSLLILKQTAASDAGVVWPGYVVWVEGSAPVMPTTADSLLVVRILSFDAHPPYGMVVASGA